MGMSGMKGIDEFVWILAIAMILIVVFMGVGALMPANQSVNQTANATAGIITTFQQLGFVGYSSSYSGQMLNYGSFTVGQPQSVNLKKAEQLDMCAGLWCNRMHDFSIAVPDYYIETMKDVKIYLAVYDTNQYGDLVVKWNGKEFHRKKTPSQDYVITIDKQYVKGSNALQIYADGPGLMFWASTIYTIRDFKVDLEYGPAHINTFALSQSELSAWDSGSINFYGSGQGNLRIRMNGNIIFQGSPNGQHEVAVNFSTARPKLGENLIVMDAPDGSIFLLNNVQLRLSLLTNQVIKTRTFQLGTSEYNNLVSGGKTGKIELSVNSIQRDGDFSIKLNSKTLAVPRLSVGNNTVYFTNSEAARGTNTLELSGSGYWDISDVTIVI